MKPGILNYFSTLFLVILSCVLWALLSGCRTVNVGCTVAETSFQGVTVSGFQGQDETLKRVETLKRTGALVSITQTATDARATVTQGKETPFDVLRGVGQGAMVPVGQAPVINSTGATNTQSPAGNANLPIGSKAAAVTSAVAVVPTAVTSILANQEIGVPRESTTTEKAATTNPTTTVRGVQSVPASAPAG